MEQRRRSKSKKQKVEQYDTGSTRKQKKGSKKKKLLITVGIIILVIFAIILCVYLYAKHKLGFMDYEPIDKSDLGINENLYEESDTTLSENEFNQITNIVLFGSDSRDVTSMESGRSDTIVICSINPLKKTVKLISIPRDTYVSVDGYGKTKINHAYAYGKEQLSIKTINQNFGLNLDKYVTIDFSGLIDVINKVGGISLTISKEEMNYINSGLASWADIGKNVNRTKLTKSGTVTLTGEQALVHSRNRTTGGSDFVRADRQRQVIEALMKKASSMSKDKLLSLVDAVLKDVKTNITSDEYLGMFTNLFTDITTYANNVISAQIPSTDYSNGQMISGVYYFVSDMVKAKADFVEYIYNK